ncbi:hypothetical protein [Winogradskyella sp. PC D3.3]
MSKLVAFTYSLMILVQSFNIGIEDLSKFSVLLDHAEFHKEMYGDTFFQFLAEHYGNVKDNHQDDHKEHKDLPFKDAHHLCSHTSIHFIDFTVVFDFTQHDFTEIPFNFYYTEPHTNFEKTSVFQPPKFA